RNLVEQLEALATRNKATVFMVLLTAFKALLASLSGQTDIAVATACHGRFRPAARNLIGPFSYPLVLRTEPVRDPAFAAALGAVRTQALSAYDAQEVPFAAVADIASEMGVVLPQVMLSVLSQPLVPTMLGATRATLAEVPTLGTDFD